MTNRRPPSRKPSKRPAQSGTRSHASRSRSPSSGRSSSTGGSASSKRPSSRSKQNDAAKWVPVGVAGAVLAAVIAAGVWSGGDSDAADTTAPVISATSTSLPPTTESYVAVEQVATTAAIQKFPIDSTLAEGMAGDEVERLQQRLTELAFNVGPVDGYYGPLTRQAVWAYEKLVMGVPREQATGQVTPAMWDSMQDPFQVAPRRRTGGLADHVEIYLPQQVMVIFHADVPVLVAHVSSGQQNPDGTPFEYSDDVTIDTDEVGNPLPEPITKPIKGLAKTPPGVFTAGREVTGERNGPLGTMWDPVYINQGIAIHGANNVPLEPASHGCIRVSRYLGPIVQDLIDKGDSVLIWDGKKEPEQQTAEDRQMIWDWVDLSRTTTTTSTTTTTTTLAPPTTPAPATTKPPATTTAPTTSVAAPTSTTTPTTVAPVDGL